MAKKFQKLPRLAQLLLLLLGGNANSLVKQLLYMKIISPEQDTDELRMDIEDLVNRYIGADLDQMDGILEKLINTMIKHGVTLPREFVMIGRGVALIEDIGYNLDKDFNIGEALQRFSKKLVVNKFNPVNVAKGSYDYLLDIGYNKEGVPYVGSAIFLHCRPNPNVATAGCISVSKDNMIKILQTVTPGTTVTVYQGDH